MGSSVSPTYGAQEEIGYNGHFGCTCYHPRFVFNRFGDLERCTIRTGNVHTDDAWHNSWGLGVGPAEKWQARNKGEKSSAEKSRQRAEIGRAWGTTSQLRFRCNFGHARQ